MGYLRAGDGITMNRDRLLADAKVKALALAESYRPPQPPMFTLPGPSGAMALSMQAEALRKLGKATAYDLVVAAALAGTLTGGDADVTKPITEKQLLAVERAAFMTLVRRAETLARIRHTARYRKTPEELTMPALPHRLRDHEFCLHELFDFESHAAIAGFGRSVARCRDQVLEQGGEVRNEVVFPLNRNGDEEGCTLKDGVVTTPRGFKDAYRALCDGGWPALTCDPADGGQGLPHMVNVLFEEMMGGASCPSASFPV